MQAEVEIEVRAQMPYGYYVETPFSNTDWGMSAYVIVRNADYQQVAKFRMSDHSVQNINRLFGEIHIEPRDISRIAGIVEYALFPKRWKTIETFELTNEWVENAYLADQPMEARAIPARAEYVGQRTAKKSGRTVDVYRWQKANVTRTQVYVG